MRVEFHIADDDVIEQFNSENSSTAAFSHSFVVPRRHEELRITAEQFMRFAGEESPISDVKTVTV